jgi:DNA-binding MarR family transcriptional regulator
MTTAPAVYGQFGQALGLAERTLSANLRAHLADRDIEPEAWYALQLVATRGPRLARTELAGVLESPYFDAAAVHRFLARLETEGLITGDDDVELTDEGKALHTSLREYIAGPTVELLNQFDTGDIETTVRTLRAITQRAAERLAASGR